MGLLQLPLDSLVVRSDDLYALSLIFDRLVDLSDILVEIVGPITGRLQVQLDFRDGRAEVPLECTLSVPNLLANLLYPVEEKIISLVGRLI